MQLHWLLPEAVEDMLPREAAQIEMLRRRVLDEFVLNGYELVQPPLLEYMESLLTAGGADLDLRTCKLVDQLSGRTMGIRADLTPQLARIDAHLLNRIGVTRLCYCAQIVHAIPLDSLATREPLQTGVELYGHAGIEADIEILRMMARSLELCGSPASRIELGHVRIFHALVERSGLNSQAAHDARIALRHKDRDALRSVVNKIAEKLKNSFLALVECHGGTEVLTTARRVLPSDDENISCALNDLEMLASALKELPIGFDLADLRGYTYHNGIVAAAYGPNQPNALALGGRYDNVGEAYGRARPATGFSFDLRQVARRSTALVPRRRPILALWREDAALHKLVEELRSKNEVVLWVLPGHEGNSDENAYDRKIVFCDGVWQLQTRKEHEHGK